MLNFTHISCPVQISIVAYSKSIGSSWHADRDIYLATNEYLLDSMCLGLAGRVAEQQVFNEVSTHGSDDLTKVSKIAKDRVEKYGKSLKRNWQQLLSEAC